MAGYTPLSDDQPINGILNPIGNTSSTVTLGWVDMKYYKRNKFTISVGAIGSGENLAASVVQATTSTGAGSKALATPIAITAITASNKSAVVNVSGPDLDTNNGFEFAALSITLVNTGTNAAGGTVLSGLSQGDPQTTPPPAFTGSQVVGV
jgi:hypothetical protein